MKKILFLVLFMVMGTQILIAESYQRWIYWVSPENHEVTANEMAEIASLIYDNKVIANKEFTLSSGVRLRIPQPSLYISYIEKAVRSANPAVLTKDDVVFCLNDAEKMRWGNDVSGSYRNYYYSYAYKGVRSIDNFSGEGKEVDFLFINGIPTIKCDCGNPIENKNPPVITTDKEVVENTPPPAVVSKTPEPDSEIKIVYRPAYSSYRPVQNTPTTSFVKKKNPWKTVCTIGGITIGIGVGYFIYSLFQKNNTPHITPGEPGGAPTGDGGSPGGTPTGTGGGGPGGSPL